MRALMILSFIACPAFAALAQDRAAAPDWTRPPAKEGYSYPDCYCTNRGERVELGRTSCLRIGSDEFTARCAMSLNTPTWRREKTGCDPEPSVALPSGAG